MIINFDASASATTCKMALRLNYLGPKLSTPQPSSLPHRSRQLPFGAIQQMICMKFAYLLLYNSLDGLLSPLHIRMRTFWISAIQYLAGEKKDETNRMNGQRTWKQLMATDPITRQHIRVVDVFKFHFTFSPFSLRSLPILIFSPCVAIHLHNEILTRTKEETM